MVLEWGLIAASPHERNHNKQPDALIPVMKFMRTPDDPSQSDADQLDTDETRMRQALGLTDDQRHRAPRDEAASNLANGRPNPNLAALERGFAPRPKRRFVQDGEVPVVMLRPTRRDNEEANGSAASHRIEAVEAELRTERAARQQAEQALAEAKASLRDLRTQLVHMEMARNDALAAVTAERAAAEALRTTLHECEQRLGATEESRAETEQELKSAESALLRERRSREAAERALARSELRIDELTDELSARATPRRAVRRAAAQPGRKAPARRAAAGRKTAKPVTRATRKAVAARPARKAAKPVARRRPAVAKPARKPGRSAGKRTRR